jgi:serine/threonine protein kinase
MLKDRLVPGKLHHLGVAVGPKQSYLKLRQILLIEWEALGDAMTPQRWERLKTLFNEALERPWQERRAYVVEACGEDLNLRSELSSLVELHEARSPITEMISTEIERLVTSLVPRVLASGDLILDRFEIVRPLGSGGMGDVYEAKDRELQQTVALKMIRAEIVRNESILALFKREVQLARRLSGPNICRIHELFVTRGEDGLVDGAFLTMELLDGITLADKLNEGPLPWREAHAIAMDICAGLAAMHRAGIIHRDLKSRNIMLANRDGAQRAVLMDFGLAHQLSQSSQTAETVLTIPGAVQGTPEYMAPEQFEGGAATAASDVYAMGVILYELVTGKHPFASSNPLGAAVLRGKSLAPPSSITHNVPHKWDVAIRTCLKYEATQRYQSADELARALGGSTLDVRVLQKRWSGLLLAVAGSALIAAYTWLIPALRERVERVPQANHEKHVAVLPFDIAGNNQEASILADGLMDSLAGRLSSLDSENETLWVVPPSEIRRRKVNDPGTALREFGATVVVKGYFSSDRGAMRLNLELIDSKGMREIGYADIVNREQDLSALQNEAVTRLSRLIGGEPAMVAKQVNQFH